MTEYIVSSGQTSSGVTLSSGDLMSVTFGGTAVATTVSAGGTVSVFSGGVASSTTDLGGIVSVFTGGTAVDTTVTSGGFEVVDSGGVASSTTLRASEEFISFGGTAIGTTVSAGSDENVFGVASDTTVSVLGSELIFAGGVASGTHLLVGGTIDVRYLSYSSDGSADLNSATDLLTVSIGGQTYTQTLSGDYTGKVFQLRPDNVSGTDIVVSNIPCFCRGTTILTDKGERPVELLATGDRVIVHSGAVRPIKWIGRRKIDLTAHPRPETVAPIRIVRHAFAHDVPHADLLLSGDHAVFIDGKLICARQLINGATIRQETGWTMVDYFHVELDTHAILLAAGLPAESYLDTGNRGFFGRSGEPLVLHPDLTEETSYPAREAASCAPFVWDESVVFPVWQTLARRAVALGQPMPQVATTDDAELSAIADGRTLWRLCAEDGRYIFVLPKQATEVHLVSRASAPTDCRPWLDDRRCLGVYVERIQLRGSSDILDVPVDHPGLSRGWWAVERNGTVPKRWTNGDAVLPLPRLDGPTLLEVRASSSGLAYVTNLDKGRRAA
jgi:autotransporter passenger strand-loop-strand repeat protein